MLKLASLGAVLLAVLGTTFAANPCNQRQMQYGTVCVCDSNYCDTVPKIESLSANGYQLYSTNKGNLGFHSSTGKFSNQTSSSPYTVSVPDLNAKKQTIIGFGGAFTGSASYNILQMPEGAQNNILESYFGEDGIRYTVNRVVMGASDFSTVAYSNVDTKDETLNSWALQDEDNWRIEVINKAAKIRGKDELKLFISSWSSPLWMKTENNWKGSGQLKPEYYQTWADYYLKYLRAYRENGVEFWGITAQNEPFTSPTVNINLKWTYATMNEWLVRNFGPTIRNSEFKDIKIMLLDDDTYLIPAFKSATFPNASVMSYADGFSIHWYSDGSNKESYWNNFPSDKFILATEACQNVANSLIENKVELGNWDRGTDYIKDILYATFPNASVMSYADGFSIHWYSDGSNKESYWNNFPSDKFILATEACQNVANSLIENKVELGNWDRGTDYIKDILYATFPNASVMSYADGFSIHWYTDSSTQPSYWNNFPSDKFILATEACQNVANYLRDNKVELGNWDRGTDYIKDILYDLEHNFVGWVEWNLALDLNGGPSWMHASLDAPIIVNITAGEFYKEPMFYVMGHFSKFIVPGSVKVTHQMSSAAQQEGVLSAAFVLPNGNVAVSLSNTGDKDIAVDVTIEKAVHSVNLLAHSINTLLYKPR